MKGLGISFQCLVGGPAACLRGLAAAGALPVGRAPTSCDRYGKVERPVATWFDGLLDDPEMSAFLTWEEPPRMELSVFARGISLGNADEEYDVHSVLKLLAATPFLVAVGAPNYPEWETDYEPTPYLSPGIGDGHSRLGWFMAFQGSGHVEQLVSRRWLKHGPWRLLRGDNDTSLVQFHDLDVDEPAAREQATPGHALLRNDEGSGYLQLAYPFLMKLDPHYDPSTRQLRIEVGARDVPVAEMQETAAARGQHALGDTKPIDLVKYVFDDEARARRHLHALWLRGHEVWLRRGGTETRLDEGYAPPVESPAWVRDLEQRDAAGGRQPGVQ